MEAFHWHYEIKVLTLNSNNLSLTNGSRHQKWRCSWMLGYEAEASKSLSDKSHLWEESSTSVVDVTSSRTSATERNKSSDAQETSSGKLQKRPMYTLDNACLFIRECVLTGNKMTRRCQGIKQLVITNFCICKLYYRYHVS